MENSKDIMATRATTKIGQIVLTKGVTIVDPQFLNGSGLFELPVVPGEYNCYRETAEVNGERKTVSFKILLSSDGNHEVLIPEENDLEPLGSISIFDQVGFFSADGPNGRTEDFFGMLGYGFVIQEHFGCGSYSLFGALDDADKLFAAKLILVEE